jgi:hypothetical protein
MQLPATLKPRIEFIGVPSSVLIARLGSPLLHVDDGLVVDFWAFELDDGSYVSLEHVPEMDSMMLYSDSSDIQMLRSVAGLGEFRNSEVRKGWPPKP